MRFEQCPQAFGRIIKKAPTFRFRALFGSGYAGLGNWGLAAEETERAREMRRKFFGSANPAVAEAGQALAEVQLGERDLAKAQESAQAALNFDRTNLPVPNPQTARDEATLGWVFCEEGKAGAGLPLLENAYRADRGFYVPDSRRTATVMRRLAECGKAASTGSR